MRRRKGGGGGGIYDFEMIVIASTTTTDFSSITRTILISLTSIFQFHIHSVFWVEAGLIDTPFPSNVSVGHGFSHPFCTSEYKDSDCATTAG